MLVGCYPSGAPGGASRPREVLFEAPPESCFLVWGFRGAAFLGAGRCEVMPLYAASCCPPSLQSGLHDLVCDPAECGATRFIDFERALTYVVQKVLPYERRGTKFIWWVRALRRL